MSSFSFTSIEIDLTQHKPMKKQAVSEFINFKWSDILCVLLFSFHSSHYMLNMSLFVVTS